MNLIQKLFSSDGFMPHGHCYVWNPWLIWLHVVSDSLIALAYLTIPLTLIYIARKRKDLPFEWMFACFGVFILACGATHALEVWTLWTPTYWLSGMMKAITAAASAATAILLVKLIPRLLSIPGSGVLREANSALREEAVERRRAEDQFRTANEKLQTANEALRKAHAELTATNEQLLVEARERRQAEQALREGDETLHEAKEAAERANAAKGEFLSRMSHELRTPLNSILGFGQLLEMDGRHPEEADNIAQILKAGRHLLELVDEVLDVSRLENGSPDPTIQSFRVGEAIEEALALVRPLAAQREVALLNLGCEARVLIDRQHFKKVVFNLLANAIKYNRRGGRVTLAAEETGTGMLRLAITDNGPGIAAADTSKVFAPFERLGAAETKVEGLGLGLTISERLVERMGGRIGVESVLGEGSTFWIEVPLAESPDAQLEQSALPATPKPESAATGAVGPGAPIPSSGTLLHIEGNASDRRLFTRIVARRPAIRLLSAATGALGLEMAREHRPDLILLDLHLPDIPGDQVLAQLRANSRTSEIPVVMLSAGDLPATREQMLAAGARAFFTKPVEVRTLLGVLDQFIEFTPEEAG